MKWYNEKEETESETKSISIYKSQVALKQIICANSNIYIHSIHTYTYNRMKNIHTYIKMVFKDNAKKE